MLGSAAQPIELSELRQRAVTGAALGQLYARAIQGVMSAKGVQQTEAIRAGSLCGMHAALQAAFCIADSLLGDQDDRAIAQLVVDLAPAVDRAMKVHASVWCFLHGAQEPAPDDKALVEQRDHNAGHVAKARRCLDRFELADQLQAGVADLARQAQEP